jgi:D-alanyl-lipoteichoic acid acyltransferase DltB (MBOAT superfamily)
VYDEFHDRNLAGPVRADVPGAQRRLGWGILGVATAMQVPIWPPTGVATPDTLPLWAWCALSYFRGALFLISLWMMAEGAALLFGVTLRPNWPRTLLAENPAQLWRAWRATMTNWLIRYVYVPLGGRDRRTLSVLGAFGVSVLWHWSGIPFTTAEPTLMQFLPVLTWGVLNAVAVIGWTAWRRRMGPPSPSPLRRAGRIAGTFVLGTFTVTLLGFTVETAPHFPAFMRRLTGLPPLREIAGLLGLVD